MPIVRGSYGVGWGTLALINAGLAQAKGQSGLLWGFLSLLLGPLATLLLVTVHAHPKKAGIPSDAA
jgi:hypothetical protein